jgi:hypothetical protein
MFPEIKITIQFKTYTSCGIFRKRNAALQFKYCFPGITVEIKYKHE